MVHRKKVILFMMVFVVMAIIPLVSSVPPVQSTVVAENGLEIQATNFEYLEQNKYHVFRFRVYNASDNVYINPVDVQCSFGLIDNMGEFVYNNANVTTTFGNIFMVNVSGGNFSRNGFYHTGINCLLYDGSAGGVLPQSLEVNNNGVVPTEARAIMNAAMLFILLALFVFVIWLMLGLNKYKMDEDGKIMSINKLKYLKFPLFAFAYTILLAIFFISSNIGYGYLGDELFADLFFAFFTIGMKLLLPIIMLVTAWFFVQLVDDKKIAGMIERGVDFEGSKNQSVI